MDTLLDQLKGALSLVLSALYHEQINPDVTQSTQAHFGHYQCNAPLKLGKKRGVNPRILAEEIATALLERFSWIAKAEVAGPGFINMTLSLSHLEREILEMASHSHLGIARPETPQKIIVEFSSPNVAKELHVGHLRSTIIGDSLARVFTFLGHQVLRLNHIGDWGTQFGMLIAYIKGHAPAVFSGDESADLPTLMGWYKESKKCFDDDPLFKKRAQLEVVALQGGDPVARRAWEVICTISRKAYQEIYALLDVKIEERGESFYNQELPLVVEDLEKKGLITLSDGAKCIFLEGFISREGTPLPMIVQKSDGGYNYSTTDMAAMRHRTLVEKADRIIVVTDGGQRQHFSMIAKACEKAGYLQPGVFSHVTFGVVLGKDGKKFKTRSGETEKLIDLLYAAIDKARELVEERLGEEVEKTAKVLGIDAIKYADLSTHRQKDYTFSYEKMLRLEGNTAPFMLYAYVRIRSIQKKVGKDVEEILSLKELHLEHETEISLALHLRQFGEALEELIKELLPNRLTDYLHSLAEKFHAFFRDCRVEGSEQEKSRLLLCELTARVLQTGFSLLGLETVDKM